jgi:dimethylamine---corrinoid protein Co-methyltransferase
VGDPFAMAITHAHASGMGGMRAAGDLVARLQMTRGMKIAEAKKYVADRLKISVADLCDPVIMTEVRQDLQLGTMSPQPRDARGIEAKFRIAEALGIDINCVQRFRAKAGLLLC